MKKPVISNKSLTETQIENILTQFRSDMFTRFDQIVGELAQIREDWLFTNHEIKELKRASDDHEVRIKDLEVKSTKIN